MTVRDIIEGSMRLLNAISTGQSASAVEAQDGLSALNQMISSWSTEGLTIFREAREEFDLVASQQIYTIGIGGNFNTSRPISISNASFLSNGAETPVDIIDNQNDWANVILKATESASPNAIYLDGSYPLNNIYVWPVPSMSTKLVLYSKKPLTSFASVNDVISLPDGYERAIRFNLAIEMAPEFGKEASSTVVAIAQESLGNIKRQNIRPHFIEMESAIIQGGVPYDIVTGVP